jgi:hypothetical protein
MYNGGSRHPPTGQRYPAKRAQQPVLSLGQLAARQRLDAHWDKEPRSRSRRGEPRKSVGVCNGWSTEAGRINSGRAWLRAS